jgi:predicted amidohydrolase
LRIQAYQNNVFIASCNRVGREGQVNFAGESLVIDCEGKIVASAGGKEQLLEVEIDLKKSSDSRKKRPYLAIRRPEMYPESKKK